MVLHKVYIDFLTFLAAMWSQEFVGLGVSITRRRWQFITGVLQQRDYAHKTSCQTQSSK